MSLTNNSSNCPGTSASVTLLSSTSTIATPQPVVNTNSLGSDPATKELSNFLTQLSFKKNFEDEDSDVCNAALVLMTPEVSRVMASLVGVDKKELKVETREMLVKLEKFFKEYLKAVKVNSDSKALELLQEMFCNPEFIVFQQLLCNQPKDWIELGLPVIHDKVRKEVLVDQIQKDIQNMQLSRRELAKDIGLRKKELETVKAEHEKKKVRMSGDNARRLAIALESYKSEREKLEDASSKKGSSVNEKDVTELLSRFEKLNVRHKAVKEELSNLSSQNALPPDIDGANSVLNERKEYLEALMEQIKNQPIDFDLSSSFSSPK